MTVRYVFSVLSFIYISKEKKTDMKKLSAFFVYNFLDYILTVKALAIEQEEFLRK